MNKGDEVVINIASVWDVKNHVWVDARVTMVGDTYFLVHPLDGGRELKFFLAHRGETWLRSLTEEDYA